MEEQEEKKNNPIIEKMNKNIFVCIITAIVTMLYYVLLNMAYENIAENIFTRLLQGITMVLLAIAIVIFEIAYKKDSGRLAISGIEALVIACHTLSITYVVNLFNFEFKIYIIASSFIFAIYFVFKAIILYTKGRQEYLNSFSDISDILKEEPIKKEATKKTEEKEED